MNDDRNYVQIDPEIAAILSDPMRGFNESRNDDFDCFSLFCDIRDAHFVINFVSIHVGYTEDGDPIKYHMISCWSNQKGYTRNLTPKVTRVLTKFAQIEAKYNPDTNYMETFYSAYDLTRMLTHVIIEPGMLDINYSMIFGNSY